MSKKEFIAKLQDYFGTKYNSVQLELILTWLSKRLDMQLPYLFAELVNTIPLYYKMPPGIAELDKAWATVKASVSSSKLYPPALPEKTENPASPEVINAIFESISDLWKKKRIKI